jgi:hypothetical protein
LGFDHQKKWFGAGIKKIPIKTFLPTLVKAWLCDTRDELEAAHAECDRLRGLL